MVSKPAMVASRRRLVRLKRNQTVAPHASKITIVSMLKPEPPASSAAGMGSAAALPLEEADACRVALGAGVGAGFEDHQLFSGIVVVLTGAVSALPNLTSGSKT